MDNLDDNSMIIIAYLFQAKSNFSRKKNNRACVQLLKCEEMPFPPPQYGVNKWMCFNTDLTKWP